MSTGLNCELIEAPAGRHYYILERGSAPKNAWDWREYADAYGPFESRDEAYGHLAANHANPGGSDQVGVVDREAEPYKSLLAEAARRAREADAYALTPRRSIFLG